MTHTPASGTQHRLVSGPYEAMIASIGATLRCLTHDDRPLVVPFDADEVRPAYRGATLAPWPNRVVDGRYRFGDVDRQLALTEPDRGHALHGLATWLDFEPTDKGPDHVTLTATVVPQTGYPWRVRVDARFALAADGLTYTLRAVNESDEAAPVALGAHPYLVAGPGALDTWTLQIPADRVLDVTPDRLVPRGLLGVAERGLDFRAPRVIGDAEIDHAFTAIPDAREVTATVTDPSGTGVALTWDPMTLPWVQVHTADLPGGAAAPGHRVGLAVEPMTGAPDAFNASRYDFDTGLVVLAPGAAVGASWRLAAI